MAALIRRLRACGRAEEGAELIEFVIVFPILMLILAGILDFGMMFRSFEVVTNASREGARVAILPGYTLADVQLRVQEYLDAAGLKSTVYIIDPDKIELAVLRGFEREKMATVGDAENWQIRCETSLWIGDEKPMYAIRDCTDSGA